MNSLLSLYNIEYLYTLSGFILSLLSFYVGISVVIVIKKEDHFNSNKWIILNSIFMGLSFYAINLLVNLSVSPASSMKVYILHAIILILLSGLNSYGIFRNVTQNTMQHRFHLSNGLSLATGILVVFSAGNLVYFNGVISFYPLHLVLAVIVIIGFAMCLVRFLYLIKIEEKLNYYKGLKLTGAFAAGTAFLCLPYLLFYGMIDQTTFSNPSEKFDPYLVSLAFILICIGGLIYIPDRLGIIRQMEQSERLAKNEQQFQSLFHHNPDAVFSINTEGRFISVNYIASEYTGYSISELKKMTFDEVISPSDVALARGMFHRSLKGEVHQFEVKIQTKKKDHKELYISTVPIMISGKIVGVYGIAKDITENNRAEKMIHYLAYHDELTSLPNRRYFNEKLNGLLQGDEHEAFAVMLIDFDRFKRINDLFGHEFGDRVLQAIGKRLEQVLNGRFVVARLGGDEFTILVTEEEQHVARIAKQVLESFQQPLLIDTQECLLTASIGISLYPHHGSDAAELLKHADMAMYDVKDKTTNNFAFYIEEMSNQTLHKIILENDLRRAIDENELVVYYQPKINTFLGKVIGFEALVRWKHPNIGLIPPDEFIQAAEETGLIIPIEKWVMRQACEQIKQWHVLYEKELTIAVNLSQRHFNQEDIVCTIHTILTEVGLEPESLEIEITESMAMFNEEETIEKLHKLRELGLEISMDDFGTGYSSLNYMKKLPINRLKIDRLFIKDITNSSCDLAVVTTIISMARHLELDIIAEGVETEEQLSVLKGLECYEVQGYLYSKPIPAKEIEEFMETYVV
ncbi:putative bifunctional diguanylate cyclase/phosphodiesterase [Pseudalkalibacillus hwajinpoensis]|uniref:EAL domain-containing protein n=1 Tax=Guptibacillus hwajinpoensis TaxID=208199 RepID=A0A4U1MDM4_9BACL|nr:EAL domain-containing protein [Pseudalkalibacillus hwajinpoensis]TKD68827.1 EAL domain-containing protein [Pseudalkalibacillus hwajinpoensis]